MECLKFTKKFMNSISSYGDTMLISAYKKSYNSNHVLLRLQKTRKKSRDNKNFVSTVLMDLSKAFDCIPHDLLSARLDVHSYSKRRKQGEKIHDTESAFQILLSGMR